MGLCDKPSDAGLGEWSLFYTRRALSNFSPQTIRSDPAFGAFQILKLFLEYVSRYHSALS